ncbi:MAG: hypothetical protein AAGA96_16810 [Verrucomicrobiota bacterium]
MPHPQIATERPVTDNHISDHSATSDYPEKAQIFLEKIKNTTANPGSTSGLRPYLKSEGGNEIYAPEDAANLIDHGVEQRMKVKISRHYEKLVVGTSEIPPSRPLEALVTARTEEVADLTGDLDPSSQLNFSPVPGLLHKYEMALLYVARTCSAHCRYCYRLDLFSGKSGKKLAKESDVFSYINAHNQKVSESGEGQYLREVLLSGGDPLVLTNLKLAKWLSLLAEAGVRQIRIGTKELAFHPSRFDDDFFEMLQRFNEFYPEVRIVFAVHFTHPDEFLVRDRDGEYLEGAGDSMLWMEEVERPIERLAGLRHFVSIENQTPIIRRVNDSPQALRILQRELYHKGVGNHYFFQCRRIEGHRAFALPVEETYEIFRQSQIGLSGVESHARLVMSAKQGKIEVIGKVAERMVFKLVRDAGGGSEIGAIAIARENQDALWIDDYRECIESDPAGFLG